MFKTKITILLACAAGMAATSTVADAQGRGGQACFFERPDYRGRSFCVDAGRETPRLSRDWDDRISSIEIDRRVIVEICERPGFRGRCQVFDRSVPNLGRRGDNRISSFRVDRSQRRPVARACFYDRPDFRGRQFCAEAGEVGNRLPPGWDNRISSIRLEGDAVAQVCPFPGLNGRCRIVDRDMRFVGRDLNDRISSYRVDDDDRRRVGRGGRDGRAGAPPGIDDRLPPRQRAGDDERQGRGGRDGGRDGRGGRGGAPDGRDRRGGDDLAGAPDGGGRGGATTAPAARPPSTGSASSRTQILPAASFA